uniref:Oxidoreductase FAD/NAD(P)-binding domain-containing protein n=1 Tax=Chrysolophus pictus TaxID=9089 RepID=A0A8C3LZG9_CHRPC
MSQYIKTWKEGDTAFWRGPFGGFPYRPNKHGELLMLASGTGLAPMLPILQSITDDEEDETFVTLVGCFCTFEKIYLKPLLQDLARYWNIRIFYILSQETSLENLPWSYQGNTYTGRLNEDLIKTIINSCRRNQVVIESNKVSPEPSLLQTEQSQLPQPLLIRPVLQTPHQFCCPSLNTLQESHLY